MSGESPRPEEAPDFSATVLASFGVFGGPHSGLPQTSLTQRSRNLDQLAGRMPALRRGLRLAVMAVAFTAFCARADDAPNPPARREIYVPTQDLKTVLAANPRAVLLTRDQYEALLRDAKKTLTPAPEPPERAVLVSARYTSVLNGDVADVQAEFTVNVLSDKWAEVPLSMGSLALGEIKLDGDAAVVGSTNATRLLIRGRGEHKITAVFMLPVQKDSGVSSLRLCLPRAASGIFTITLPPGSLVESPQPVDVKKSVDATVASLAPAGQNDALLTWRASGQSQQAASVLFQECSYLFTIDETKVQADLGIVLDAALGSLPTTLQIKIPPGATPLQVLGGEVLKWTAADGSITVDLTPGDRKTTGFRVLLETPSLDPQTKASLPLPLPEVSGVRRAAGKFAVLGGRRVKIREITAGDGATQASGLFDNSIERDVNFVAAYGFAVQPASLKVAVEKIAPRFSADLDTFAEFKREAVFVERTLSLNAGEGELFGADLEMPAGEELVSVRCADGSEPDWKADGAKIKIRWSDGLAAGGKRIFKINSRIEPPKWPETDAFSLGDLKVAGAETINGYLAIKADSMFRLETSDTAGLERRDGRTTPVKGDFAWFRRETFKLGLKLARRAPEVRAALTGYALPAEGALDVNGQLGFSILYSGVKTLRVKVSAEAAAEFYFDGPEIAERNRNGDTWTILLQKETVGNYALKFHAVIPFKMEQASFQTEIPRVEPLDVKQQSGVWAVEANTATEINFKADGMNELDPNRAPALADYQPLHHVIGVFGYLGARHSLKLEGVRHEAAPILSAVADKLELDTVVSTSGAERHQALFYVRTTGDQFLDITLPEASGVWSLTVDDQPLKPVSEKENVVRVQLPATLDRTHPTRVQLLYETRKREWGASGGYKLVAPRLETRIPVLQSVWRVWLPDGFSYTAFDSNLRKSAAVSAKPLLLAPLQLWKNAELFHGGAPDARKVRALFAEAEGFYDTGRYALAYKRYEQILGIDPNNIAARKGEEKVNAARKMSDEQAYSTARSNMNWPATDTPEWPVRKYLAGQTQLADKESIQDKLNRIIIPKIEFHDATVREAIDFLKQKSRECDPDPDPARRGVNFVLKLENVTGLGSAEATVPLAPPAAPEAEQQAVAVPLLPYEAKITLSLTNIPLGEALRYVTNLAGLKMKIDPYAVMIVPLSEPTETLITKVYHVPQGWISNVPESPARAGSQPVFIARQNPKDYLTAQGVQFGPGTSVNYFPGSGKLVVRNTESQLDLVDQITQIAGPSSEESKASEDRDGFIHYGAPIQTQAQPQKAAGLLPMKLELERTGTEFSFEGFQAADKLEFHYLDWWSQARRGWIWWTVGMLAFFAAARYTVWRRLVWGALLLTFLPLCIAPSMTGFCNALLVGWLTGFLIHQIATRLVFRYRVIRATEVVTA